MTLSSLQVAMHAQWELSAFAGGGSGRMLTDLKPAVSRGEFQKVLWRPSFIAGADMSHPLSKSVRFTTGIHWSMIRGGDEHWIRGFMAYWRERELHYIAVPLIVELELWRFRLGLGLQGAYLLEQRGLFGSDISFVGGPRTEYAIDDLGLWKYDLGPAAQASVRVSKRLTCGLRYYRGLVDIKDHSDYQPIPLWNEQAIVAIAYQLIPKRRTALRDAKGKGTPLEE